MFEKEAEEYRKNFNYNQDWHGQVIDKSPSLIVEQSFQDGAEFGYNLAKEEIDYLNKHWRSEEERKDNEWHYIKDGNLPKDDENFICMLENGYKLECYYDPTTKRWYDNFFHHDIEYGYYQSKVIAWKEIVLSKEL